MFIIFETRQKGLDCWTYHWVWLSGTRLSISKKTTIVAFPGIVQHLFAQGFIDDVLICVFRTCGHKDAIIINSEAIMWPKRVIKSKGTLITRVRINEHCCRAILNNIIAISEQSITVNKIERVSQFLRCSGGLGRTDGLTIVIHGLEPFSLSLNGLTLTATFTLLIFEL